jgi:hypothetical protein
MPVVGGFKHALVSDGTGLNVDNSTPRPPEVGPTKGDNMTVARIIAITVVVCAAIGMTTQAEAAKRKSPPGSFQLQGCAYWMPLCGTVMGSAPNIYVLGPSVPWNTPITVFGQRTGPSVCWGQSTQVAVTGYAPNPKISCQFR